MRKVIERFHCDSCKKEISKTEILLINELDLCETCVNNIIRECIENDVWVLTKDCPKCKGSKVIKEFYGHNNDDYQNKPCNNCCRFKTENLIGCTGQG